MLKNIGYLSLPLHIFIAVALFSAYSTRYMIIYYLYTYAYFYIILNILTDFLQSMAMYNLVTRN